MGPPTPSLVKAMSEAKPFLATVGRRGVMFPPPLPRDHVEACARHNIKHRSHDETWRTRNEAEISL